MRLDLTENDCTFDPGLYNIRKFCLPGLLVMADGQTISVSQLFLVILLGGLVIRWLFFSSSSSRPSNIVSSLNNNAAREADVETIQSMFPQILRRSIMWDLQRNGGNVAATTERILGGRGLEEVSTTSTVPYPCALCQLFFSNFVDVSYTNSFPSHHQPSNLHCQQEMYPLPRQRVQSQQFLSPLTQT